MNAIMEKKEYIKPEVEVINLEPSQVLATSSIEVKPGESGSDQLSHGRRGKWGDLWADDESK